MSTNERQRPEIRDRRVVYENNQFTVSQMNVEFGASVREYFTIEHGQRAGLVVRRGDDILLVRQYRMFLEELSWEIPGGGVKESETPEQAAVRECLEESGILCKNLKPLLQYHVGLDVVHNPTHLYYTEEFLETGRGHRDGQEIAEEAWIPLTQCIDMIQAGCISDSFSIAAILAYKTLIDDPHE